MSTKLPGAMHLPIPAALALQPAVDRSAADDVLRLFDECGASVRRYICSFGLDRTAADDVIQEVFLALFRHLVLGRPQQNIKGWLFQVAHNLALKQRKRAKRIADVHTGDLDAAAHVADASANPEEQAVAAERQVRLQRQLEALPERDRQCLLLRAEGLTYRDIARVLGVSLGFVAKSLARSLSRLEVSR